MAKVTCVSGKAGLCGPRASFEPQHSWPSVSLRENKGACSGNIKLIVSETSTFY